MTNSLINSLVIGDIKTNSELADAFNLELKISQLKQKEQSIVGQLRDPNLPFASILFKAANVLSLIQSTLEKQDPAKYSRDSFFIDKFGTSELRIMPDESLFLIIRDFVWAYQNKTDIEQFMLQHEGEFIAKLVHACCPELSKDTVDGLLNEYKHLHAIDDFCSSIKMATEYPKLQTIQNAFISQKVQLQNGSLLPVEETYKATRQLIQDQLPTMSGEQFEACKEFCKQLQSLNESLDSRHDLSTYSDSREDLTRFNADFRVRLNKILENTEYWQKQKHGVDTKLPKGIEMLKSYVATIQHSDQVTAENILIESKRQLDIRPKNSAFFTSIIRTQETKDFHTLIQDLQNKGSSHNNYSEIIDALDNFILRQANYLADTAAAQASTIEQISTVVSFIFRR